MASQVRQHLNILIYLLSAAVLCAYLVVTGVLEPQIALFYLALYSVIMMIAYRAGRKSVLSSNSMFRAILFSQLMLAQSREEFTHALLNFEGMRINSAERNILCATIGKLFDLNSSQLEVVRSIAFAPFKKGELGEYDKAELRNSIPDEFLLKELVTVLNLIRRM